jgi:hypothetical protein
MADVNAPLPGAADRAAVLLAQITSGQWGAARADFTEAMAAALDEDGLREAWEKAGRHLGVCRGTMGAPEISTVRPFTNVSVPLDFTAGGLLAKVTYNPLGQVAGLHFSYVDRQTVGPADATPPDDIADRATALLRQITAGEWGAARADFTDAMAGSLGEDDLREVWRQVTRYLDGYKGTMGSPEIAPVNQYTNVTVPVNFTAGDLLAVVSFDPLGRVSGLHFSFQRSQDAPNPIQPGDYALRCSDGHFYTATWEVLTFRSVHFFSTQFRPCPADGRWRMAQPVDQRMLTDAQRAEAARNRVSMFG